MEVVDRDPSGAWAQVRHILIGVLASRSDEQRTRERIMRVREEIASGQLDFAAAVERYSNDPPSRDLGGDVGWLPIDNFLGETRAVVESLRVGDVSEVAEVEGGFHVFKLIGEQAETDYNFEEIRGELRNLVELDERQKRFEEYLAELRTKTYVEIRTLR
jgi:peptidyl-prolyl cis-trans isomerase SurA